MFLLRAAIAPEISHEEIPFAAVFVTLVSVFPALVFCSDIAAFVFWAFCPVALSVVSDAEGARGVLVGGGSAAANWSGDISVAGGFGAQAVRQTSDSNPRYLNAFIACSLEELAVSNDQEDMDSLFEYNTLD